MLVGDAVGRLCDYCIDPQISSFVRIELSGNRQAVDTDDPRLADGVADNINKWELTESESLLFGRNFGVGTDIQTGPNGHLYVVSLSHGAVYEIGRAD